MPKNKSNYKYAAGLMFALVIAFFLRVHGIDWGLPSVTHPEYSYHPDELLTFTLAKLLVLGKILDKHFIYGGTLYYTILNAYTFFGEKLSAVLGGVSALANSILIGRYFLVFVALLTILLVYECGCRFSDDKRIGLVSAVLLAIAPAHIVWAQRVRPDEIAALFTAIILLLSLNIVRSREVLGIKHFVYSGLAVGGAASLRLPLVVFIFTPLTAYFLAKDNMRFGLKNLRSMLDTQIVVLITCAVLAFAVTSPHVFLYPEHFMDGIAEQWQYQSASFPDAVGRGPGIYQYGWRMLHQALGYALYILVALGTILAFRLRTKSDILLLATVIPYFFITTLTSWVVVRYMLPILPVLVVLSARLVVQAMDKYPRHRTAISAIFLIAAAWTLSSDVAYLKIEAGRDIRDVAAEWIEKNLPPGSSILTVKTYREDYYFNPVISKKYSHPIFYLSERSDSRALFRKSEFDFLVLNEYLYKDVERLGSRHPSRQSWIFYESLEHSRYRLIKEFKYPVKFMGIDFTSSFSSHDYTVVNPGIRIYERE